MISPQTLQTLYSILCKVTVQVGAATFAEDAARLQTAKEELEAAIRQAAKNETEASE